MCCAATGTAVRKTRGTGAPALSNAAALAMVRLVATAKQRELRDPRHKAPLACAEATRDEKQVKDHHATLVTNKLLRHEKMCHKNYNKQDGM